MEDVCTYIRRARCTHIPYSKTPILLPTHTRHSSRSYSLIPTFSLQPQTSTMKSVLSILALVACALAAPAAVAQGKYSTYGKLHPSFYQSLLLSSLLSSLLPPLPFLPSAILIPQQGDYKNVPAPVGGYGDYKNVPAPKPATYGDYKNVPAPAGGNYGTYKGYAKE